MNWSFSDAAMVGKLVAKDWQVYQRQLAGYVAGILFALGAIGTGSPTLAAAGSLVLLVLLLVVGTYAIQSSVMSERKQQTGPFIMSLPVAPMDVFWGKVIANTVIYLVPFALVVGSLIGLVLGTSRPDGAVTWVLVVAGFMLANFFISLCVAIAVESEGWNIFTMLALMTLIGPFILWVSRLEAIGGQIKADNIAWNGTVLGLLGAELVVITLAIALAGWLHARKNSFL